MFDTLQSVACIILYFIWKVLRKVYEWRVEYWHIPKRKLILMLDASYRNMCHDIIMIIIAYYYFQCCLVQWRLSRRYRVTTNNKSFTCIMYTYLHIIIIIWVWIEADRRLKYIFACRCRRQKKKCNEFYVWFRITKIFRVCTTSII